MEEEPVSESTEERQEEDQNGSDASDTREHRDEEQSEESQNGGGGEEQQDAIEFIDVTKAFGRNIILNGLNLGLPENQISMILGPSGTGKSVCINHMVGLLYPDEGDVLVHGESVPGMADDDLFEMRKKFGVLFQDGALFGSMNVFDNVAFPSASTPTRGRTRSGRSAAAASRRSVSGRPATRCRTSSPAGCASAPGSRERSC
ncbi:MAG: ATP-binding cassette domain-containing protein [Thermoleophilaceae bacterium]